MLLSYATAAADRTRLTSLCDSFKTMLVVDESHRIKRFRGGVWAPALQEIAKHARVRIILSGTPMPHSGRDMYSQLSVLWPSAELTGPRDTFAAEVDQDFGPVLRRIQPFLTRTPKEALGSSHSHPTRLSGPWSPGKPAGHRRAASGELGSCASRGRSTGHTKGCIRPYHERISTSDRTSEPMDGQD